MPGSSIFISYSHKDEAWKDRLVPHLGVLEREGLLDTWDDRRIGAGANWHEEIQQAIERASVTILLISADFLTSKFILEQEVPRLLERRQAEGLHIVPVIVRPCLWQRVSWLSSIQGRPKDGRALTAGNDHQIDADLAAIAEEVATLIKHTRPVATPGAPATTQPVKVSLARLPSTNPDLFGREAELARLDAAWGRPQCNVVTLVAWGGVGKTALVNHWLICLAQDNYRGATCVYGYSFYSQGAAEGKQASADLFIATALRDFGDPEPDAGSPWDKGERLARRLQQQRTLLILDGLEPLQYPPGEQEGRLKDPGLQVLLRELARHNPGLCVVSTRVAVDDIKEFEGTLVERLDLDHLTPAAGEALLGRAGVHGTPEELRQTSVEFGGHALALTLLGSLLRDAHSGDIRARREIGPLTGDLRQGGHARRVMASYVAWLGAGPEVVILHLLGLFDRPALCEALAALRAAPVIPGLSEALFTSPPRRGRPRAGHVSEPEPLPEPAWQQAIIKLRHARLLAERDPSGPDTLDAHPLVREHFGKQLKVRHPAAWQEAHRRLYAYYTAQAMDLPDTIEEMAPLYAAVVHGCQAGRHQEALDEVYVKRIYRESQAFSVHKLGAFGADLAAVSQFFDLPWSQPVATLTGRSRAFLLNMAGYCLMALGRLREAVGPMQVGLQADIEREDWLNAAIAANNLSELSLTLGHIAQAQAYGTQSVELADRSQDAWQRSSRRGTLATALHQAGRQVDAETSFREAEAIKQEMQPGYPLLYSLPGFRYCELLLSQGQVEEARRRATQMLAWTTQAGGWLLDIALDHLILGRAVLQAHLQDSSTALADATTHLNQAVGGLRQAGQQDYLPRGLLARAELHRVQGDFAQAQRDLNEAMTIATRSEMGLHQADGHLAYARLHLAMGDTTGARKSLATARAMVDRMGYHRRDAEVQELEKQLKRS
jgi:tetratricopeptide (TPR) repeat protein